MTDKVFNARSPGEMLRSAREKQGLHIAALAAAIKVAPRKLDALEHDRWDELPDATFVRALAQTVCRTLKIDAAPVMELLPRAGATTLASDPGGLNTPFRDRPGREDSALALGAVRPMVLGAGLLMLAAAAVYFVPEKFWSFKSRAPAVAAAAAPASAAASAAEPAASLTDPAPLAASAPMADGAPLAASTAASGVEVLAMNQAAAPAVAPAAPSVAPPPAATTAGVTPVAATVAASAATSAEGVVRLRSASGSWVEARDAGGKVLVSRLLKAGEQIGLDGRLPMRLTIGNAGSAELDFRGQAYDLKPLTRDNVARVELK